MDVKVLLCALFFNFLRSFIILITLNVWNVHSTILGHWSPRPEPSQMCRLGLHCLPIYFPKSKINFLKFCEHIHTVLPAKSDSDVMFCLQYYQGLIIYRSLVYEGCSNMNANRFITFVTYMLRQNGIRFYKGFYVTFKLAPDLKQNTLYFSSYRPLNMGHFSILTISMLRTYQWYRRAYNSSINRRNFLKFLWKYPHILI